MARRGLIRAAVALGLAASIAGCARPSERIATELVRYGLDESRAQCVGQRLERDLSVAQLRELAGVVRAYRTNDATPGQLTVSDLLRVAASVRDPSVPVTVARAATGCGVTITDLLR
ncbi:MAG: hypothetical protein H0V46_03765 [Sphingomonas sp.]|nr:hypothetical protein [Sphingomonas sp.]